MKQPCSKLGEHINFPCKGFSCCFLLTFESKDSHAAGQLLCRDGAGFASELRHGRMLYAPRLLGFHSSCSHVPRAFQQVETQLLGIFQQQIGAIYDGSSACSQRIVSGTMEFVNVLCGGVFRQISNALASRWAYQSMVSLGLWKWRAHLGPHLLIVKIIWEISPRPSLYSSEGSAYLKCGY